MASGSGLWRSLPWHDSQGWSPGVPTRSVRLDERDLSMDGAIEPRGFKRNRPRLLATVGRGLEKAREGGPCEG